MKVELGAIRDVLELLLEQSNGFLAEVALELLAALVGFVRLARAAIVSRHSGACVIRSAISEEVFQEWCNRCSVDREDRCEQKEDGRLRVHHVCSHS